LYEIVLSKVLKLKNLKNNERRTAFSFFPKYIHSYQYSIGESKRQLQQPKKNRKILSLPLLLYYIFQNKLKRIIMRKPSNYLLLLLFLLVTACGKTDNTVLLSPDNKNTIRIIEQEGQLYYTITNNQQLIVDRSSLGFALREGDLSNGLHITDIQHSSFNEIWQQPWGEEVDVVNHYNQMKVEVEQPVSGIRFSVVFRAFNDGVGFRYEFPEQTSLKEFIIMDELTEFNFTDNHQAWSIPWDTGFYEGLYTKKTISQLDTVCTPLTLETETGKYITIHEANLTDYAAMNLTPVEGTSKLKTFLTPWSSGEKVFTATPMVSPWRTLIVADSPGDLLLSRIMLNLNEPSKIADTSWIKPGRYIGIWWAIHMDKYTWKQGPIHGATTENTKRYMDFAAKYGFSGVLVEGWNIGWEHWSGYSFTEAYPDFDIEEITRYGKEIGVELIGHHETGGDTSNYESQLEEAFAFYQKYGVNAVKTGYVGGKLDGKERHSSQYGVRHYRKVIETAAKYQIMIDNHEPVMPTGLQRTWPNLMTQEGVRGQEWDAWSKDGGNPPGHTTIIPFTRGLAGPMDFTPGTFNFTNTVFPDTRVQTTLAKQLALSVILFSPLQMASDMIENYENQPAFEFITSCPTTWQKTVVPHAKIGEYVTIARKDRDSEDWFVGSITNAEARSLTLSLDFLDEGATYTAKIFSDGAEADYKTNPYPVDITEKEVTKNSVLDMQLASGGGTAIIIKKNNK